MKVIRISKKVLKTLIYPITYYPIIVPLDQLAGEKPSFLRGLKDIWVDEKKKDEKTN